MSVFHLMRHAERVQSGDPGDPGLSELGRRQAGQAVAALGVSPIARVYTSPLGRARETAEVIAASLGLVATTDERLRERMNWGDIKGQTLEEFVQLWERCSVDRDYVPPHGISARQASERMRAFMCDVSAALPTAEVVAVSHGGVISDFLMSEFSSDMLAALYPNLRLMANCARIVVRFDGMRFSLDAPADDGVTR